MKTRFDPNRHHRRSIRLPGHDYRQAGAYFVTICTFEGQCVLDDPIVRGIIKDVWKALPTRFPTIALDEFVVMPNHVHLIAWLCPPDEDVEAGADRRAGASPAPTGGGVDVGATLAVAPEVKADWVIPEPETVNVNPALSDVIGTFKSLVFAVYLDWILAHDPTRQAKFWQRNYYEHVIRNERELNAIRQYIADNPAHWAWDTYNPTAAGPDPRAAELWRLLQAEAK